MGTSKTADQVCAQLAEGNARFVADEGIDRDHPLDRARSGAGQRPIAAILACSDSRVPVETVFDAGIGELFVVRSAGGVLDDVAEASIRYATEVLGAPVVVVLGHEGCGAVDAALDTESPEWLEPITSVICGHLDGGEDASTALGKHVVRTARDLASRMSDTGIRIVAAVYGLRSGHVHWLELE